MPDSLIKGLGLGLTILGLSFLSTSCHKTKTIAVPEDASANIPLAKQNFDGVTINVIGLKYPIGNAFEAHAKAFEAMTGAKVVFKTVIMGDVYNKIAKDYQTGANDYDLIIFSPIWLPDFVNANYLADLTPQVAADAALEWDDIVPFFQKYGSAYNNKIYGIPVDGDYYMLYYRSDLLEKAGFKPPSTWDEYLTIAKEFHGKDLNGDGTPDYGSCLAKKPNHVVWWSFWSIAGSFLQSQGTSQGGFFDPETMKPLTNNEAFAKALDIYQETGKYAPPDELQHNMDDTRALFIGGRCALTMDHGNTGTLTISPNSQVTDKVGTTIMPGSKEVLDRQTGKLVACDKFICPFSMNGVNHAPYASLIGWSAGVNASSPREVQEATYAFISYVSQPAQANVDVTVGETGFNPYRVSQLTDIDTWVKAGMSSTAANKYLGGIGASLNNSNIILDLTIPNNNSYLKEVLDPNIFAFLEGKISRDTAMENITTGWEKITDEIGREKQKKVYRLGLGLEP